MYIADTGKSRHAARPAAAPAIAALLLLAASACLTLRAIEKIRATYLLGEAVRQETLAADTVLSTLTEAETGQRGFLLTGDPDYLGPYQVARARIAIDLARLAKAPPALPGEADHVAQLKIIAEARLALIGASVTLLQAGRADDALAIVRTHRGRQLMAAARHEVQALHAIDDARLARAQREAGNLAHWIWPIGSAASACLLLGVLAQQWHYRNAAEAAARAGQERLSRGFGMTQTMLRDPDGRITNWGPGMEAMYGFTEAMAVGRISHDLLCTRFPIPLAQIEEEIAAQGDWNGELIHRCRDGSTKTVMSRWVLQRDAAGDTCTVMEMNFDITALRQAEAHLRIALEAAGLGTWMVEFGANPSFTWDSRARAAFGTPADVEPTHALWESIVLPEDLPDAAAGLARLRDPADPLLEDSATYRVRHPDGSIRWLVSCRRAETVEDPSGPMGRTVLRLIGTVCDVTEARQLGLERDRIGTLLRNIVETAPGPIYAKDTEGRFLLANAGALAVLGQTSWEQVQGRTDLDLLPDKTQARALMANDRQVMQSGQAQAIEELAGGTDGNARTWLSTKTPMRAADGRITGMVGISVEITERKRAEARRELMIHELNHRVKNTLATVQAVASETLKGAEPAMRAALNGRLMALAGVHDILTRESWQSAELGEVVAAALAPFGGAETRRFEVRGPYLLLMPRAAVALSMGLHELATNATKYGALHVEGGHVSVLWGIVPNHRLHFSLTWTEHGGPPVVRPSRRSFGSSMIEGALSCDLAGTVTLHFDPGGVRCEITAPLDEVAANADGFDLPNVGRAMTEHKIQ